MIEDDFCKEVIFRLEGTLIRFDSRRELLQIAREWGLPIFQANLLMAQIVESVRQHGIGGVKPIISKEKGKKVARISFLLAAIALFAVIIDWIAITFLNRR